MVNLLVNWLSPLKERSLVVTGEKGAFVVDTLNSDLTFYENGNYEVKFGNDVFGRQLQAGDQVVVYYIVSDNINGSISRNAIGGTLYEYTTSLFDTIYNDVKGINTPAPLTSIQRSYITFSNPSNSTVVGDSETIEQMRVNVPKYVSSNFRLTTARDYTVYLQKSLNKLAQSVYVASNDEFLNEYINYFYKISVDPSRVNRVLLNQVNFADSCDFNNVNVFCVPTFNIDIDNYVPDFMPASFKNLIVDSTQSIKTIGAEVVPRDPVYVAFKIGISNKSAIYTTTADSCRIVIKRDPGAGISKDSIKSKVVNTIKEFFASSNNTLGQNVSLSDLSSKILSIAGVRSIQTINKAEDITFNGISFITWNPLYPEVDVALMNQDTKLPFFKFPYLMYPVTISNYIDIVDE